MSGERRDVEFNIGCGPILVALVVLWLAAVALAAVILWALPL